VKCAARGSLETDDPKNRQKIAICAPPHNMSGYIFATKACIENRKKLVKQQYLLHVSRQNGERRPLTPETGNWRVWGTPTNFNGFRVLASLLQRRRSPEANQTLRDVWPSPGLVHLIYIFGRFCPH